MEYVHYVPEMLQLRGLAKILTGCEDIREERKKQACRRLRSPRSCGRRNAELDGKMDPSPRADRPRMWVRQNGATVWLV